MELNTLQEMTAYLERKFTSDLYKATASTQDTFGPSVKFTITWTPREPQRRDTIEGPIWCSPSGLTSAAGPTK